MQAHDSLRMTPSRKAILAVLGQKRWHPTAEEVLQEVRRALPGVGLATVYRNLEVLREQGLIRIVTKGRDKRRYDAVVERHYHVRCVQCGRVEDVDLSEREWIEDEAARASGFEITNHELMFLGTCGDCARARTAEKEEH